MIRPDRLLLLKSIGQAEDFSNPGFTIPMTEFMTEIVHQAAFIQIWNSGITPPGCTEIAVYVPFALFCLEPGIISNPETRGKDDVVTFRGWLWYSSRGLSLSKSLYSAAFFSSICL